MYIPKINEEIDIDVLIAFMQQYSFGLIINTQSNIPVATHLPFIISKEGNSVKLVSHFAKANKQWQLIESTASLVIFSEPHAYISPRHYESKLTVPTWNYISVHAYGKARLLTDSVAVRNLLESTITNFENDYLNQWNSLPEDFKTKMINGIVAFEIIVSDLQGKKKLSQNKKESEQRNIISALSQSPYNSEKDIAKYMAENLPNKFKRP